MSTYDASSSRHDNRAQAMAAASAATEDAIYVDLTEQTANDTQADHRSDEERYRLPNQSSKELNPRRDIERLEAMAALTTQHGIGIKGMAEAFADGYRTTMYAKTGTTAADIDAFSDGLEALGYQQSRHLSVRPGGEPHYADGPLVMRVWTPHVRNAATERLDAVEPLMEAHGLQRYCPEQRHNGGLQTVLYRKEGTRTEDVEAFMDGLEELGYRQSSRLSMRAENDAHYCEGNYTLALWTPLAGKNHDARG